MNKIAKISRTKITATMIAIFLMLSMTASLVFLPSTNAHSPPWNMPTYAYITAAPDPIGVSQTATIVFWVDKIPPTAAGTAGDRWFFLLDIKAPDNTTTTQGPFTSDPVGGSYYLFTPDMVGTYTFTSRFGPQVITGSNGTGIYNYNIAINNTYAASTATTTLTVQQDAISAVPNYPLPTEYWTRPIEGQNTQWYSIASNWLGSPQIWGKVQLGGSAPDSPHIMWTQPYAFGGVVGGDVSQTGVQYVTYYDGTAYEGVFGGPLIIQGKLYYPLTLSDAAKGSGYVCVDLMTGKQIWYQNWTSVTPTFGQLYDYESINQHGMIRNGYLWASQGTTLIAYDPLTGNWLFNETNVPTGTAAYGPNGEILRYVLSSNGKWLALWNNTAAHGLTASTDPNDYTTSNYNQWRPVGKSVDASTAYSWNVSVPLMTGGTIQGIIYNDVLIGSNGTLPTPGSSWNPYTVWAISLKPESRGTLLWMKNYDAPTGNITLSFAPVFMSLYIDPTTRVFTMYDKEEIQWVGFSVDNGTKLWQTQSEVDFNYYADVGLTRYAVANGKLYSAGYAGVLYCYDLNTGQQLWNYTALAGLDAGYPGFPLGIGAISDGKVFLYTTEHSANAPHLKGVQFRWVNATTGAEIWTIDGYGTNNGFAIADGYFVYLNLYDLQIYNVGKGPSQITVTASPKVSTEGSSVIIEGSVTDIATGTKQTEQAARFPNGVPAVSDDSMSAWMDYVYMQKPRPTDTKGVPVTLSVIDSNNNERVIGQTTSNDDGFFTFNYTPDITGQYTVFASFEGSKSYWPSHAVTSFAVDATAPTATPSPVAAQPPTEMYFIGLGVAIIIAIAIGFIATILILRKKP
jgi:outer membrane protein assembly factor BamB